MTILSDFFNQSNEIFRRKLEKNEREILKENREALLGPDFKLFLCIIIIISI